MKKVLSLLCVLSIILGLTACGSKNVSGGNIGSIDSDTVIYTATPSSEITPESVLTPQETIEPVTEESTSLEVPEPSEAVSEPPEEVSGAPEVSEEPSEEVPISAIEPTPEQISEPTPETVVEDGPTYVNFVDAGQADGCVIVTSNGGVVVIDAGEDKSGKAMMATLNSYNVSNIDMMVLTHPHADHIGAAQVILENYDVKEVVMSSFVTTTKVFSGILDTLEKQTDVMVTQAKVGDVYTVDNLAFNVLAVDTNPKDNNNSSVVMKMDAENYSIMFTGDAEAETEAEILKRTTDIQCDILKVGHHGSSTSTSYDFLNAVKPKYAIISCGEGNKYGHPHKETIELFSTYPSIETVYRTDLNGTITVEISSGGLKISTEK